MLGIEKTERLVRRSLITFDGAFRIQSNASFIKDELLSSPAIALMYSSDQGAFAPKLEDWIANMISTAWRMFCKDSWFLFKVSSTILMRNSSSSRDFRAL